MAWNATEANSEATVKIARAVSKELGIELLETNVDGTPNVGQAAEALIGRGVQAIWVGGDLTVMVAVDAVIGAARRAHIPVFSNIPDFTKKGAIFDLGANYFEVGRDIGRMARNVLPRPTSLSISSLPPCRASACLTIASPSPDPPEALARPGSTL